MLAQDLVPFSVFNDLSEEQLAQILPLIEPCDGARDAYLFEQGDPAENLYVVEQGEVEIRYKAYDGPVMVVARVKPGGVIGWSAALGRSTYTSGAVCLEDSRFFCISKRSLRRLCDEDPETGEMLMERLACAISERESCKHSQVLTMLTQNGSGRKPVEESEDCG